MSKFVLPTILLLLSGSAIASIVTPNCRLSWSWSFNSLGQNACTIAAYLLSTCNAGSFTITSLAPGKSYPGPSGPDDTNLCKCNTVVYNLMSACDGCQGGAWITWSQFSFNCTTTLPPSTFPNLVPAGTRVPQWALLDPTPKDNWNNITAFAAGDSPELAPGAMIGLSNTPTSHSSGPTQTSASPTKGGSSNGGAVAGGVIGGIAAISIIVIAVLCFVRRQRSGTSSAIYERPPMDEVRKSLPPAPSHVPTPTPATMRPHDLNVPTTIPGNQRTTATQNTPAQGQGRSLLFNSAGNYLSTLFSPPQGSDVLSPI